LTPSDIRSWNSDLAEEHPSTAAGAYRLLSTIYKTAVNDELSARSPCRIKGASTERPKERPTISVTEIVVAVAGADDR